MLLAQQDEQDAYRLHERLVMEDSTDIIKVQQWMASMALLEVSGVDVWRHGGQPRHV